MDCTESNDEDGGEEEEEVEGNGAFTVKEEETSEEMKEREKDKEAEKNELGRNDFTLLPKWEDFFTTDKQPNSQNSLTSQSCCSAPSPALSRMTGSQTPELFSEEEEAPNVEENFSLTLSASLSNHSSQNQDSELADTLILHPEKPDREELMITNQNVPSDPQELPGSQESSDFEIPCTPESKPPRPDDLLPLYRKLAAGEELIIRKSAQ